MRHRPGDPEAKRTSLRLTDEVPGRIKAGHSRDVHHHWAAQPHQLADRRIVGITEISDRSGQCIGTPNAGQPLGFAIRGSNGDSALRVRRQIGQECGDNLVQRRQVIRRQNRYEPIALAVSLKNLRWCRRTARAAVWRCEEGHRRCDASRRAPARRLLRDHLNRLAVRRAVNRVATRWAHHDPAADDRQVQRSIDETNAVDDAQGLVDMPQALAAAPSHHHQVHRHAVNGHGGTMPAVAPKGQRPAIRSRCRADGRGQPLGPWHAVGMTHGACSHPVTALRDGRLATCSVPDSVAVEEPLEMRLDGQVLTTTMRTPGNDVELAHGWLLAEGIIHEAAHIASAAFDLGIDGDDSHNVLELTPSSEVVPPSTARQRVATTTASCGVCGTSAIDVVHIHTRFPSHDVSAPITSQVVSALPDALRQQQPLFDETGGTHGAGLATTEGAMLAVREDIGRHNAVDKVLGWALMADRVPLRGYALVLSGRAGFELVQKAAMAGVPVVVAVGAPTALAVEVAERFGITLVGFVRNGSANVYTRPDRIIAAS